MEKGVILSSILRKTIRDLRGQIIGWGIGLAVLSGVTVLLYPTFQGVVELEGFVQSLPPAMQKLFGEQMAMNVPEVFLKMKLFDSWLPIILSVFAVLHGAAAVAGEEERRTIDLLMANPIGRRRVVLGKFAATAIAVAVMSAIICAALVAGAVIAGVKADLVRLVWATFNMIPIVLVFGGIALAGSCFFHRARHASSVAVVILIFSYVIYVLAPLSEALQPWLRLSLFYYYGRTEPIGGRVHYGSLAFLLGLTGMLVGAAVILFRRKDLVA